MTVEILQGDCLDILPTLEAGSVHCCITSPPYWGLRDYGTEGQLGLEATPEEYVEKMVAVFREVKRVLRDDGTVWLNLGDSYSASRGKIREDELQDMRPADGEGISEGEVRGLLPQGVQGDILYRPGEPRESTNKERCVPPSKQDAGQRADNPEAARVAGARDGDVGREVSMLRGDDPSISDSGSHQRRRRTRAKGGAASDIQAGRGRGVSAGQVPGSLLELQLGEAHLGPLPALLKPKDLVGIPWMVAFALRADGWYLRSDIIWSKPNPMPESVTDRPTKAHEYVFLLSKSKTYYYDAAAIAEASTSSEYDRTQRAEGRMNGARYMVEGKGQERVGATFGTAGETRNKRSVWEIPTQSYSGAHFATFPEALVKPCMLAGCPEGGTVLDPFGGSGTVGVVARKAGRSAVLVELSEDYCQMMRDRMRQGALL